MIYYQRSNHIEAIANVVQKLKRMYPDVHFHMLPDNARMTCDMIKDGATYAKVKIICRSTPRNQYKTFDLGLKKVLAGRKQAAKLKARFLVFIQFSDYLCELDLTEQTNAEVQVGGRWDRNDANDVEEMVKTPYWELKVIEGETYKKPIIEATPPPPVNPQLSLF